MEKQKTKQGMLLRWPKDEQLQKGAASPRAGVTVAHVFSDPRGWAKKIWISLSCGRWSQGDTARIRDMAWGKARQGKTPLTFPSSFSRHYWQNFTRRPAASGELLSIPYKQDRARGGQRMDIGDNIQMTSLLSSSLLLSNKKVLLIRCEANISKWNTKIHWILKSCVSISYVECSPSRKAIGT